MLWSNELCSHHSDVTYNRYCMTLKHDNNVYVYLKVIESKLEVLYDCYTYIVCVLNL